jgi:hypothetical protein
MGVVGVRGAAEQRLDGEAERVTQRSEGDDGARVLGAAG